MDALLARVNQAVTPYGVHAEFAFAPSVFSIFIPTAVGAEVLVAVDHNGPFWEAVYDVAGDQDSIELPDGPANDADDLAVAAYVAALVEYVTCRACELPDRGCLEHTCPDCGHVGASQIDPATRELTREHACPTPSSDY